MSIRFALKAATDDVHRELDERLSRLNLAKANDYRLFLGYHARTIPSIERSLASAGLGSLVEGWSDHRRSAAIKADIQALGEPMPAAAPHPELSGVAELLGTAYVLEGSRLGGRVLLPRVGAGLPVAFLSDNGSLEPWPTLLRVMERLLRPGNLLDEAKDAARRTFNWYLELSPEAVF